MAMTITEKIMARAAGRERVSPGEIITCKVDSMVIDEIQFPIFKKTLEKMKAESIRKEHCIFVVDHFCPPTSLDQARNTKMVRDFALSQGIKPLEGGIKPQLLVENAMIRPGMFLVGTDSHMNTCGAFGVFAAAFGPSEIAMMAVMGGFWFMVPETIRCEIRGKLKPFVTAKDLGLFILGKRGVRFANYKAIEFCGETIREMSTDGRVTLCNMSTEMGAKNGIVEPDAITETFLKRWNPNKLEKITTDPDASYGETLVVDASKLDPLVAFPHSPGNVKPISEAKEIKVDQGFIGSCGNGNLDDLKIAAGILKGKSLHPRTRLIITPASRRIYLEALSEGFIETFLKAGATVSGTTCSVCPGQEGTLLPGEVCITSSPRNFKGRPV
jgi:homoaconitate hydratase family protein